MKALTGLHQFLAVCSTRNFTAAASLLGISQPALTQAVGKLERQLGVELFDRSTRPLGITSFGKLLREYAEDVEHSTHDLSKKIEEMKTGSGGVLRFGCGPDWIHEILPRAICSLQEKNPDIRVELTVSLNNVLLQKLDIGEIDFFFASISDVYFGAAYTTRILVRDRMLVIANANHPIHEGPPKTLESLTDERWVMTGDETFGRQLMRRIFGQHSIDPPLPVVETNSVRAMLNIVRYSDTLGFLSQTHCNAYDDIRDVAMDMELPIREGGVTWRNDNPLLPGAKLLIEETEKVVTELFAES